MVVVLMLAADIAVVMSDICCPCCGFLFLFTIHTTSIRYICSQAGTTVGWLYTADIFLVMLEP